MKKAVILLLSMALLRFCLLPIPALAAPPEEDESIVLTMELEGVHVFVRGEINGKPARFCLDTGAGGALLNAARAANYGIASGKDKVKISGATNVDAGMSAIKSIRFRDADDGKLTLDNCPCALLPFPEQLHADLLIGAPLFENMVVTLDYANKKVLLQKPRKDRPADGIIVPLRFDDGIPYLSATIDGFPGEFEADTGSSGGVMVFGPFAAKNKFADRYPRRVRQATGKGIGGILFGELIRVPTFSVGGMELKQVVSELSLQKEGGFFDKERAGNIGGEVWRRFTVTLDYPNKRLILKKNASFDEPFAANNTGLGIDEKAGYSVVIDIVPGSPAAEACVKVGDTLLAVDGLAAKSENKDGVRAKMRRPAGTPVELLLRTGDTGPARTVKIILRDLL